MTMNIRMQCCKYSAVAAIGMAIGCSRSLTADRGTVADAGPKVTASSVSASVSIPTSLARAVPADSVTVTGRVTNLEAAKPYLSDESYFQLLLVSKDGHFGIRSDAKGLITFNSDLAKSPISSDGAFRLQASKLDPGNYYVVIQKMQPGWRGNPFLVREKKSWTIEISPDAKLPLIIEGGDLELPKINK